MLTRYCLALPPDRPCRPRPEWAYRLYAALLARASASFGALVHGGEISPISQYLDLRDGRMRWTVTLLGRQAETTLGPLLEENMPIFLEKDQVRLQTALLETDHIADPEELFARSAGFGFHCLEICTAAGFKSRGQYQILPTSRLILQSLVKKWNGCVPDCPIEDEDGAGLDALAAALVCRRFQLRDRTYFLKGNAVPGFVGTLVLENRLDGFRRDLVDAMLTFSGYVGVGIKTSLGMGGVEHSRMGRL